MEQWLVAFGTIILAVVAVFQDRIRSWVASPKLCINVVTASPFCKKIKVLNQASGAEANGYFLRFCVKNRSALTRAFRVEVFASELLRKGTDGKYHPYERFEPLCLLWSHSFQPFTDLSPGMERYCFIGRIVDPAERHNFPSFNSDEFSQNETCLAIATEIERHTKPHIIPGGTYRLRCLIGGANLKALKETFEISISGEWFDDEIKMFEKGFHIDLVKKPIATLEDI